MMYFKTAEAWSRDEYIKVYNYGRMERDFTYIDDIVDGIVRVIGTGPSGTPPFRLYNIGAGHHVKLMDFLTVLAEELIRTGVLPDDFDVSSHTELLPMQPGDVTVTFADISALEKDTGYRPKTDIRTGLRSFADWFKEYKNEW